MVTLFEYSLKKDIKLSTILFARKMVKGLFLLQYPFQPLLSVYEFKFTLLEY